MTQLSFAFDWIRVTTKKHNAMEMVRRFAYGLDFESWIATKPLSGYSHALRHVWGHSIFWHIDRPEMGVNVMFTGGCLNEMSENGINTHDLLKWLSQNGFTFTRLDLAIDVHDSEINIEALLECPHTGSINSDPVLIKKGAQARGGATLYLGSWHSDKFMRIYDKAKERDLPDINWKRVEIELKSKTATKVAREMADMTEQECGAMTQRMIRGLFNPEDEAFKEVFNMTPQKVSSTKQKSDTTYEWMMVTVSKSLARLIVEYPHRDVETSFLSEVRKHIREMAAHGLEMDDTGNV